MDSLAKHLKIRGLVQGVMYRESMRQKAIELGIMGWVRNRTDGSVEALVQGESSAVEKISNWAKKGPSRARVVEVIETPATFDPSIKTFERKDTI